jgi:hypothetical protein
VYRYLAAEKAQSNTHTRNRKASSEQRNEEPHQGEESW